MRLAILMALSLVAVALVPAGNAVAQHNDGDAEDEPGPFACREGPVCTAFMTVFHIVTDPQDAVDDLTS